MPQHPVTGRDLYEALHLDNTTERNEVCWQMASTSIGRAGMSTRQASTSSPLHNSTCRHVGHEWKTGLVPTYRVCTRQHCRAAQQYVHGSWIEAPRPSVSRKAQPSFDIMTSLWSNRPSSAEPVRDREQERHAHALEQRYYKAVADEAIYRAALSRRQRGGV